MPISEHFCGFSHISLCNQSMYTIMARSRRFERLTYGLEGSCSIQLSYERTTINIRYFVGSGKKNVKNVAN